MTIETGNVQRRLTRHAIYGDRCPVVYQQLTDVYVTTATGTAMTHTSYISLVLIGLFKFKRHTVDIDNSYTAADANNLEKNTSLLMCHVYHANIASVVKLFLCNIAFKYQQQ